MAGAPPAGVHLPGPSPWPFVLPIGGAADLRERRAAGGRSSGQPGPARRWGSRWPPPVPSAGTATRTGNGAGWSVGAHGAGAYGALRGRRLIREARWLPPIGEPADLHEPPPGVHLPGPSPWPFFAPIGLMFVFMGFVFGPWLILGGLIMSVIAVAGWYRDAGSEYRQVEAGHLPEPRTRDPEKAFPKRLLPIYAGVAAFTLFVTLLPFLLSFLPGSSAAPAASGGPPVPVTTTPMISASSAVSFDQSAVVVAAAKPLTLDVRQQAGRRPAQRRDLRRPERGQEPLRRRDRDRTEAGRLQRASAAGRQLLLRLPGARQHARDDHGQVSLRRALI